MPPTARSQQVSRVREDLTRTQVSIYYLPRQLVAVRASFQFTKLVQQLIPKISRGNCALLDEQKVK
jgi:hypothetical protein